MVDSTILHYTDKQEMLQTLILCFVLQPPIDRWVHNQQVLFGRGFHRVALV